MTQALPWRFQLSRALQQRYHNKRVASRLYCALAEREPAYQEMLLILAKNAERSAANDAIRLLRLDAPVPDDSASLSQLLWQRLLVCCGVRITTLWIEWSEKQTMRQCVQLFQIHSAASKKLLHEP